MTYNDLLHRLVFHNRQQERLARRLQLQSWYNGRCVADQVSGFVQGKPAQSISDIFPNFEQSDTQPEQPPQTSENQLEQIIDGCENHNMIPPRRKHDA